MTPVVRINELVRMLKTSFVAFPKGETVRGKMPGEAVEAHPGPRRRPLEEQGGGNRRSVGRNAANEGLYSEKSASTHREDGLKMDDETAFVDHLSYRYHPSPCANMIAGMR